MPRGARRLQDEETRLSDAPPPVPAPEPALLQLQRSAGNAAVTQMVARDYA